MNPQQAHTAKTFDGYKDTYSEAVDTAIAFTGLKTDFFTRVKADYIKVIADKHFGSETPLAVLDVGCGIGNYHQLLRPHFETLDGVDVSEACIETARAKNPSVAYKVYDGGYLPYESASFDMAFTICVLHHVPTDSWPRFMREMRRILKPNGLAIVFEHNPRNPLTMKAVNSCPFDEDAVLLKREMTESLLRNAGFSKIASRYILTIPPANAFLRRVDQLFSRLPLGGQYFVTASPVSPPYLTSLSD